MSGKTGSYRVVARDGGGVDIVVTPAPKAWATGCAGVLVMWSALTCVIGGQCKEMTNDPGTWTLMFGTAVLCSGIVSLLLLAPALFKSHLSKWAGYRRYTTFAIMPEGILTSDGVLAKWEDIVKLYLDAMSADEMVIHTFNRHGGVSQKITDNTISRNTWTLFLQHMGREHVLAGGMSAVVANSVMHEVQKRIPA